MNLKEVLRLPNCLNGGKTSMAIPMSQNSAIKRLCKVVVNSIGSSSPVLDEIDKRTQSESQQAQDAEEYVDTQLAEMADEGMKFDRNKLLKFMVDFQGEYGPGSLLDTEGKFDFRKSLKLMEQLQPEPAEDKTVQKQLASQAGRAKANGRIWLCYPESEFSDSSQG